MKDTITYTIEALADDNLKKRKSKVREQRIELQSMKDARKLMSEYLNFLPVCKNGELCLVSNVCVLINRKERGMKKQPFKFEDTKEAAYWNAKVMNKYDYDYSKIVKQYDNSILIPGSEFRSISALREIIHYHQD